MKYSKEGSNRKEPRQVAKRKTKTNNKVQEKPGDDRSNTERDKTKGTTAREDKHTMRIQGKAQNTQGQKDEMTEGLEGDGGSAGFRRKIIAPLDWISTQY